MKVVSSQSFPKQLRIKSTLDFKRVFSLGSRSNLGSIRLISLENSLGFARLGLVAGKKYLPKAVMRARFKRVIRELFRKNKQYLGSRDYIVVCSKDMATDIWTYDARELEQYIKGVH